MFPSKISLGAAGALLAATAVACGPWFPSTIIDSADAILAAPFAAYAVSLARIPLPPSEFHARLPIARKYPSQSETNTEQTLAAEIADLTAAGVAPETIAQHRARRLALDAWSEQKSSATPPSAELARTDGLPADFADYHRGAVAHAQGDLARAMQAWRQLLDRPAAERKFKSTWAAFMLARTTDDVVAARAAYRQVRQLAHDGFADSLGLAAASFGWEAQTLLNAGDCIRAADLYLAQLATGDTTAINSLRIVAQHVLTEADDATRAAFARDSRLRETVTALLLARREQDPYYETVFPVGTTARWLAALESAAVLDAPSAAPLALAAYRAGDVPSCARWLKLASADDDLATWLRAKLALREGRIDDATAALSRLVGQSGKLAGFSVYEDVALEARPVTERLRGELGALKLARRDYTEALGLLLDGGYWEDAAYIAESVLTPAELKNFVDTHTPAQPVPGRSDEKFGRNTRQIGDIRQLLARRLVRLNRLDEARIYFSPEMRPRLDEFIALIRTGRDPAQATAVRAATLMQAARLLRADGMELRGTELGPDGAIHGGSFESTLGLAAREALPASFGVSADERERVAATGPEVVPDLRFHYRYVAADLAWEAIMLMPDNADTTAAALNEAGSWLKRRDPRAANRFYLDLVRRCGNTTLGRVAAREHWFPK